MVFRSVGDKIAVSLQSLGLPISENEIKRIVKHLGFEEASFQITDCARSLVGKSKYRRGAKPAEAPDVVDCSSMAKWIYGQMGGVAAAVFHRPA